MNKSIMRRQVIAQCAEAHRQHISRERVRLAELQYTVDILHQQEQEPTLGQRQHQHNINPHPPPPPHTHIPPPPSPFNNIPYHQPPPLPYNQFFEPPPPPPLQLDTTDPKSPLAKHLQLVSWPTNFRATSPPKYHRNTDPRKFLMCYEAAIASAGEDEATLAKSFIISLEDATTNWYSRLPSGCIYSWQQLKEKFLLNF
jgi:hypothetical protein